MNHRILDIFMGIIVLTSIFSTITAQPAPYSSSSYAQDDTLRETDTSFPPIQPSAMEGSNLAWSIVAMYPIPNSASGLAYDGTYLYCGIYGTNGDDIYRINMTTGAYQFQCNGPQKYAYGLTFDGTYLWTINQSGGSSTPAAAFQFDFSGNLISQFNLPTHYMSGIAYDNGDFWVSQYYPDPAIIYKVNETGSIITSFTAPDNQPWDLCMQNTYLWMADYWGDTLYKINSSTGTLIESHTSEYIDPAGIVWDGQYLWYCDEGAGGTDYLYKVDLSGSGTPEISVPTTSHNYAVVTIGESVTWNASAQNTGTANLQITSVSFSGPGSGYLSCPLSFPLTITPGNQTQIPFIYAPLAFGELNATATITSNDPIHPTIGITLTGNAVYPGPEILLPVPSHNYGPVRINAYTRWFLEIENAGDATLTITAITSNDAHFILDNSVTFPFNIGLLESAQIGIWFQPQGITSYSGTLFIYSNDPNENPTSATVQGTGEQDDYPIGDLLWHYSITGGYDNSPKAMEPIADINGDGIHDVIICSEDDYVRCFNGNAHGLGDLLWEHEIYGGAVYSQNGLIIIEDINSDGYDDVVIGSAWGGRLIRAISGKTGTALWTHDTHEYGSGGWVYQVDSRFDYNNDGIKDILAAVGDDADGTGPRRVYCLNALTGASIWERPLGGAVFSVIGIEDCTGDGKPDVVAGASNSDETIGYAYGINGATGGIIWTFVTGATSVWAVEQIDDISNDNIKDVIIGDFYTTSGMIYGLNAATGNMVWSNSLGYVLIGRFEKVDDINNDGHPDIIPALLSTTQLQAINGITGAIIWSKFLADQPYSIARTTDITGDGVNDVLVGTMYTNNYCYWLDGTNGTELHSLNLGNPIDAITAIPDIVGDNNNTMEMVAGLRDGFIACLSGGGEVTQLESTINITLSAGWNLITVPVGNTWTAESLGDNITGCSVVLMFNATTQTFLTHVVGTPWDDFPIQDGVGYFVYVTSGSSLVVTGPPITGVTVHISPGWNIIGWYKEGNTTAESLGDNITGCSTVLMFDAPSQIFLTHVVNTPWDNFAVTQGMGLFLYTTSGSDWHGEG